MPLRDGPRGSPTPSRVAPPRRRAPTPARRRARREQASRRAPRARGRRAEVLPARRGRARARADARRRAAPARRARPVPPLPLALRPPSGRPRARAGRRRPRLPRVGDQRQLRREPLAERSRRFAPKLEPLAAALEPVERRNRGLATSGRVGELVLGACPVREQRFEPRLRAAPRESRSVAPLLGLTLPAPRVGEVELRDTRPDSRDLDCELLRALGGRRLERQRAQPLSHLLLDVAGALDLNRDSRELQLRAMPAALELPEPRRLLDERAAILGLRREHGLDLSLTDDRVHRRAEPDVREQLDEVGAANGCAVDEVLALSAANEPTRDRHLAEVELPERAVLVVEDELHLAVARPPSGPSRRRTARRPASRRGARTASASRTPRRPRPRCSTCRSRSGPRRRPRPARA